MLTCLYVGQLREGGTCLARARALRKLGAELTLVDVTPYQSSGPRWVRAFQHRLLAGPSVSRLNHDLVAAIRAGGRIDTLWVDKGTWVFPETLDEARKCGVRCLVHYTPDPAFYFHTSRHFRQSVPLYDLCVTTKRYELDFYRRAGAREVLFTWQGVDERFTRVRACGEVAGSQREGAVFIGHRERHYERTLGALVRASVPLRIYGPRWPRAARRNRLLATAVHGDAVVGHAYAATLATAKIGIGLLSKLCPDAFTTRSFEIPAAGAMLLAEDTEEHRELFRAGEEADFFASEEELVAKAVFYLSHDRLREKIARRGRDIVVRRFTWLELMKPVLQQLEKTEPLPT